MAANTNRSPLIAIRLIDKTTIVAKKFTVNKDSIWVDSLKYFSDNDDVPPVYLDDSMLLSIDSIETYLILHKGGKSGEKIPKNRDESPSSS